MAKKNINTVFLIFLFSHLIIWTAVPSLTNKNLPLDTIEALAWASNFEFGFDKHPPMSAAVVWLFYDFFGNQDWAYYFLSQIFIIISFIFVWKLSFEFLKSKFLSLLSVLLLEGIVFYNYTSPEFNVYVCQLPFRIISVYYFWKAINEKKYLNWILFGLSSGLGFLSHYLFFYLIISIIFFYLFFEIKKNKFELGAIFASLSFLIIIFLHLNWLVVNDFVTIDYASQRSKMNDSVPKNHIINPLVFIFKQLVMILPFLFLSSLILKLRKKNVKFKDRKLVFLLSINILPIVLIFFTSLITGSKIRTMWMSPFYLCFGILLLYFFKEKFEPKNLKRFLYSFLFIFLLSPLMYSYISISQKDKRTDYPGREISDLVQKRWDRNFSNEIKVVVGDEWSAGNLAYHLQSRPKWFGKINDKFKKINPEHGIIFTGNPEILKKVCPGEYGTIKPVGYCMIGVR